MTLTASQVAACQIRIHTTKQRTAYWYSSRSGSGSGSGSKRRGARLQ